MCFLKKVQNVTMGFYREERVPNHSRFDLAYSCVGRYVGWTKLHSHVFGLIPSLERIHTSSSISKKFKLRAPAVHGVSSKRRRKRKFGCFMGAHKARTKSGLLYGQAHKARTKSGLLYGQVHKARTKSGLLYGQQIE